MCVVTSASGLAAPRPRPSRAFQLGRREEPEGRRERGDDDHHDQDRSRAGCAARGSTSSRRGERAELVVRGFSHAAARSNRAATRRRRSAAMLDPRTAAARCSAASSASSVLLARASSSAVGAGSPRSRHRLFVGALFGLGAAPRLDQRRFGDRSRRSPTRLRPRPSCSASPRSLRILVPAMLARCAAHLPALGRNCAVLHHILRSATGAGEDHSSKSPLPGR